MMKRLLPLIFLAMAVCGAYAQTANIPISSLPRATVITGSEFFPIVQGGVTKRAAVSDANGLVLSSLRALGTGANATATSFSASNQALWLSGTLTGSGQGPYGVFSITDTATNTVGGFVPGLWIAHNVGSGAGEGSRMALQPILTINNALPCASGGAYCYHIAAFPQTYVGANLGGTSGVGNSRGDVYGLGGLAQIGGGGTYIHGLTGAELNSSAQAGSSVDYKSVLTLISVNSDAVQGSLYDAMLGFTRDNTTTTGWNYGIAFGRGDSTWPIKSTGTLIGSVAPGTGARTAANGVDFSGVTFSGCAFKSNLFCVPQAGLSSAGVVQTDANGNLSPLGVTGTGNALLASAVPQTAWTAYTPSYSCGTGSLTSASAAGRYWQTGKTVAFTASVTITTNGTCAGYMSIGLPVQSGLSAQVIAGRNLSTGAMLQGIITASASAAAVQKYDASYSGADGQYLTISGVYEAN